jgi:CubicO group peptidase (beta-lactamase class C family)
MLPTDKHLYMSVSKTFVSTAIAILESRGKVDSEKAIEQYIPKLIGSDWEGVKIRNLLDMASGFEQDDFEDPNSAFKKILTAWGIFNFNQPVYDPIDFFKILRLKGQQGEKFSYSDANP